MTANPPVKPRKIVPNEDCPECHGCGLFVAGRDHDMIPLMHVCDCVLDQLTNDNEPFTIDTSPNDLTRGVDVREGV